MSAVQQGMLWPRTVDEATAMLRRRSRRAAARRRCHARGDDERPRHRAAGARQPRAHRRAARHPRRWPTAACASAPSRATARPPPARLLRGPAAVVRQAASKIANATVRNMGTIGGSISFADPGLDYPPAMVAAGAAVEIAVASRAAARCRPPTSSSTGTRPRSSPARSSPRCSCRAPTRRRRARTSSTRASPATTRRRRRRSASMPTGRCASRSAAAARRRCADDEADALLSATAATPRSPAPPRLLEARADPLDDVRGSADYRRLLIPRLLLRAVRRGRSRASTRAAHDAISPPSRLDAGRARHQRRTAADVRAGLATTLLTVLRDELQLTAAKRGCNQGVCGACTVEIDGVPMRACLSLAHGCVERPGAHARRPARDAADAGAAARVRGERAPSSAASARPACWSLRTRCSQRDPDARRGRRSGAALSGNLCRCTGYAKHRRRGAGCRGGRSPPKGPRA